MHRIVRAQDETTGLLSLPPEMLHEIAIWAPLRTFGQVTRLGVRSVACVRLQRWFRSIERHEATMQLSVGDRVLVRSRAARQRMEYATAAAKVDGSGSWKDACWTTFTLRSRRRRSAGSRSG